MKEGLVSVLLPMYNAEKTIVEALESIINQTYSNIELICIDDGSSDRTLEIVSCYAETDNRIKLVTRENKGLVATLNEAIELANGEFMARMDADDIATLDRIEKQACYMSKNKDVVACGGAVLEFNEHGYICESKKSGDFEALLFKSLRTVPICHPSAMIRSNVIHEHGIRYNDSYRHAEDVKFWFDLSRIGKISNVQDVVLHYRRSDAQVSSKYKKEQKFSAFKARNEIYEYLCDLYSLDLHSSARSVLGKIPNTDDVMYVFLRYTVCHVFSIGKLKKLALVFGSPLKLSHKIKLSNYVFSRKKQSTL